MADRVEAESNAYAGGFEADRLIVRPATRDDMRDLTAMAAVNAAPITSEDAINPSAYAMALMVANDLVLIARDGSGKVVGAVTMRAQPSKEIGWAFAEDAPADAPRRLIPAVLARHFASHARPIAFRDVGRAFEAASVDLALACGLGAVLPRRGADEAVARRAAGVADDIHIVRACVPPRLQPCGMVRVAIRLQVVLLAEQAARAEAQARRLDAPLRLGDAVREDAGVAPALVGGEAQPVDFGREACHVVRLGGELAAQGLAARLGAGPHGGGALARLGDRPGEPGPEGVDGVFRLGPGDVRPRKGLAAPVDALAGPRHLVE